MKAARLLAAWCGCTACAGRRGRGWRCRTWSCAGPAPAAAPCSSCPRPPPPPHHPPSVVFSNCDFDVVKRYSLVKATTTIALLSHVNQRVVWWAKILKPTHYNSLKRFQRCESARRPSPNILNITVCQCQNWRTPTFFLGAVKPSRLRMEVGRWFMLGLGQDTNLVTFSAHLAPGSEALHLSPLCQLWSQLDSCHLGLHLHIAVTYKWYCLVATLIKHTKG